MRTRKGFIVYFFKKLALFSIPFLLFILLYVCLDPFCVIYRHSCPNGLHWNRDVQSSELFLENYPHYHYESFIFGNSKSMGFLSREWGKYIGDTNVFHFDASSEDITGIYSKLKYLDDIGDSLKNVLIITDPIVYMGNDNDWSFGYNHYYKIDGTSALRFHFVFFRGFYTNFFFASYIDYCLFNTYRPYMKSTIPSDLAQYVYDSVTNDYILQKRIKIIAADSLKFYSNTRIFRDREKLPHIHWACIDNNCMIMLEKMKHIFDNHRTNYKIVISPVYSQEQFNNQDLNKLKQLFGNTNVFDFSGKNEYTINKGNYYDNSHYKPYVAAQMLKKMYVINDSLTH